MWGLSWAHGVPVKLGGRIGGVEPWVGGVAQLPGSPASLCLSFPIGEMGTGTIVTAL